MQTTSFELQVVIPSTDISRVLEWKKLGHYSGKCCVIKGSEIALVHGPNGNTSLAMQVWNVWGEWRSRIFKDASDDIWTSRFCTSEDQAYQEVIREAENLGLINNPQTLPE